MLAQQYMNGLSYTSLENIYPNLLLKRDCSCLLVSRFSIYFSKNAKMNLNKGFFPSLDVFIKCLLMSTV